MKSINCKFLPGDRVRIGDIRGHVSCVSVSWPIRCRYEISYWDCGKKCEVWCDEFEVEEA
jgi:hypothetical protein